MTTDFQMIYCTCPNFETASQIAQHLIATKHAACVNILPSVTSVYQWQGNVETAQEFLLLIKSCQSHYAHIEAEIKKLHPYEVPEIVAVAIENGSTDYLKWIHECLSKPE